MQDNESCSMLENHCGYGREKVLPAVDQLVVIRVSGAPFHDTQLCSFIC